MANPNHRVQPAGKGVDGLSIVPGREIEIHINWEHLKREFFLDPDYSSPTQWLMNIMMWPIKKIKQGNVQHAISGWSSEKAVVEQRKTDAAIAAMLIEQRKRVPELIQAKMALVTRIINDIGSWGGLLPADKRLCYEILKNELGEPTSTKVVVGGIAKDPVEALLEEYGLMAEGRIIIDGQPIESAGASDGTPALSSGSPAEVPQDTPI